MAFLIPDNLRSNPAVPRPHQRLASLLAAGLDESVTAWYEPPFDSDGDRPHFVLLDPALGIVVVDVLDHGGRDTVLGVAQGEIRVRRDGREVGVADPWRRAERFAASLREALADRPRVAHVGVGALVAALHLTADDAESLGLHAVVPARSLVTKEHYDAAIGDDDAVDLLRHLRRATGGELDEPLDDDALAELRAIVHPDTVIATAPAADPDATSLFSAAALGEDDVVKVMDRRQERLAKGLGTGHRVIRGVAGSGKTLVLVHRARTLARLLPGKRILVTCFTRSLASQLRAHLSDLPNVQVLNLDRLMTQVVRGAGVPHPGDRGRWDELPAAARSALEQQSSTRFRAVLVDEAQDFETEALAFCVDLLEATDPAEQDLVIVADSAQNIFRRDFRWKDAGIQAQGRTRILRVNYRNTREILRFAHDFLVADPSITVAESGEVDDELAIIPAESAERSGPEPTVTRVGAAGEVGAVVDQVRAWYRGDARPRSIAVLVHSRRHNQLGGPIRDALAQAGVATFWVTDPDSRRNKDEAGSAEQPVVLSTIQSAKGLEYSRVVVCGVDGSPVADERLADRKALYVGFTRAIDELAVVTTAGNPFAADLGAQPGR